MQHVCVFLEVSPNKFICIRCLDVKFHYQFYPGFKAIFWKVRKVKAKQMIISILTAWFLSSSFLSFIIAFTFATYPPLYGLTATSISIVLGHPGRKVWFVKHVIHLLSLITFKQFCAICFLHKSSKACSHCTWQSTFDVSQSDGHAAQRSWLEEDVTSRRTEERKQKKRGAWTDS